MDTHKHMKARIVSLSKLVCLFYFRCEDAVNSIAVRTSIESFLILVSQQSYFLLDFDYYLSQVIWLFRASTLT